MGAVAAVVLLLIGVFGRSGADPSAGVTPSVTTSAAATPTVTTPPATATSMSTPTPTATPTRVATLPTEFPDIPVIVLNSTTTEGLAGRVSAYLTSLGWSIADADNFATPLDVTTVYYPADYEDAALALAGFSPGSGTTVATVIPEVQEDALTVVLGADAADWVAPAAAPTTTAEPT